ncbi:MAG: hypothetical protein RMY64_30420 [Nostoc sp. DedQUE08]|uniref:hypothetical protein n=1 Tax=Nostoc sp. DedQUE08 TaxID=3075393 RepID=UPI002AD482A4|nr:hypothetical protein [Nostoc sp. DedQUE08]MDZ8069878.1 hypothetical protein [Nostoc sp. DedQUE08]
MERSDRDNHAFGYGDRLSCRDNLKSQAIALLIKVNRGAMFVLKSAIANLVATVLKVRRSLMDDG